uniref:Uncharacterized protein n=1 Tax=Arundo donax TaxID=35708 RepID=A0A0A9HL05_ARUDO
MLYLEHAKAPCSAIYHSQKKLTLLFKYCCSSMHSMSMSTIAQSNDQSMSTIAEAMTRT